MKIVDQRGRRGLLRYASVIEFFRNLQNKSCWNQAITFIRQQKSNRQLCTKRTFIMIKIGVLLLLSVVAQVVPLQGRLIRSSLYEKPRMKLTHYWPDTVFCLGPGTNRIHGVFLGRDERFKFEWLKCLRSSSSHQYSFLSFDISINNNDHKCHDIVSVCENGLKQGKDMVRWGGERERTCHVTDDRPVHFTCFYPWHLAQYVNFRLHLYLPTENAFRNNDKHLHTSWACIKTSQF